MKNIFLLLALFTAISAQAEYQFANRLGIGAGVGLELPVSPDALKPKKIGPVGNLHARYNFNQFGLQLSYDRVEFSGDISGNAFTLAPFYRFNESNFSPLVGIGIGLMSSDNYPTSVTGSENRLALKPFIGLDYTVCDSLSLEAKLDYYYAAKKSGLDMHAISPNIGFTWYLPAQNKTKAATPVAASTAPIAVDGDDDHDGILNSKDKCPGSAKNAKVNEYGCVMGEKATVTLNLLFAAGKSDLRKDQQSDIQKLADFMKTYPKTKVVIEGYTDNSGNAKSNLVLSQKRASSVKAALIKDYQIEASRLDAKGFGIENPMTSNSTAEGRAKNRRVIAVITE